MKRAHHAAHYARIGVHVASSVQHVSQGCVKGGSQPQVPAERGAMAAEGLMPSRWLSIECYMWYQLSRHADYCDHLKAWTKPQRTNPIISRQLGPSPGSQASRSHPWTSAAACCAAQACAAASAPSASPGCLISQAMARQYAAVASCTAGGASDTSDTVFQVRSGLHQYV